MDLCSVLCDPQLCTDSSSLKSFPFSYFWIPKLHTFSWFDFSESLICCLELCFYIYFLIVNDNTILRSTQHMYIFFLRNTFNGCVNMHGFGAGSSGVTALEKRRDGNNGGWLRLRSQLLDSFCQHWCSTKRPHFLQTLLARTFPLPFIYFFNFQVFHGQVLSSHCANHKSYNW